MEGDMLKKVKVGPYIIDVVESKELQNKGNCNGCFDSDNLKITIYEQQNKQLKKDTLIHEIFHACIYVNNLIGGMKGLNEEEGEELIVRTMATSFFAVMIENPKLIKYIMED